MRALLLALALSGCATTEIAGVENGGHGAFSQPPQLTEVLLRMSWMTQEQTTAHCQGFDPFGKTKRACAFVGKAELPISRIWAVMPHGFNDRQRVCDLGHEVLHSLGARH